MHAPDKALDAALVKNLTERVQQVVLEEEHFGLEYQRRLRFVGDAARVRVHEYVAACLAAGRPPLDAQLVRAKNARLEQDEKRERVAAYALTRVQAGRKPLKEPLVREARLRLLELQEPAVREAGARIKKAKGGLVECIDCFAYRDLPDGVDAEGDVTCKDIGCKCCEDGLNAVREAKAADKELAVLDMRGKDGKPTSGWRGGVEWHWGKYDVRVIRNHKRYFVGTRRPRPSFV